MQLNNGSANTLLMLIAEVISAADRCSLTFPKRKLSNYPYKSLFIFLICSEHRNSTLKTEEVRFRHNMKQGN